MPNVSGNAYALTVLSPIKNGYFGEIAYADEVRHRLQGLGLDEQSPLSRVPQTYLARFFILDDVILQSTPGCDPFCNILDLLSLLSDRIRLWALPREDHLQSRYLVFSSNFHGDLDTYLSGMWSAISTEVKHIWEHCVAFDQVRDAASFIAYINRCQLEAKLFFVGSNDDSLQQQLKALRLKQAFTSFAVDHQGLGAEELQRAFKAFIAQERPEDFKAPSWRPGQSEA